MVLTRHHQVSMTVIDFAEAVQYHAPQYEELGWEATAAALTTVGRWPEDATGFPAVLLAEIVEHIPQAPARLFSLVRPGTCAGGKHRGDDAEPRQPRAYRAPHCPATDSAARR